jgi:hypothetical protein
MYFVEQVWVVYDGDDNNDDDDGHPSVASSIGFLDVRPVDVIDTTVLYVRNKALN